MCFVAFQVRDEERIKRKKLAAAARVEGTSLGAQIQSGSERSATDSTAQVLASPEKVMTNQPVSSSGRLHEPAPPSSDSGHQHVPKHHDKARVSSSSMGVVLDNGSKPAVGGVKEKKRKPEADLGEIHVHPTKLPSHHGKERSSSQKQSDDSSSVLQPKPNLPLPAAPVPSDQHS